MRTSWSRVSLVVLVVSGLAVSALGCSTHSDGADADGADVDGGSRANGANGTKGATPVELAPAVDPAGTVTHGTLRVAGDERTYRLYVPSELPDEPVPLFIGLHGGLGWSDQFATTNHIEGLAESNGFIVVHPDGVQVSGGPLAERTGGRGGVWNGGVCCGVAARTDADDVGFIAELIDQLAADHDIDPHRVFAFGHSNGGIMSYRLACQLADRIVGIGVVAGTLGIDDCDPARPVSVMHVHGTSDRNVPLAGGVGTDSLAGAAFPPPRDGFDALAAADGCPTATESTRGDITTSVRQPCDGGSAAAFVTIAGGPHVWPGGTPRVEPVSGAGYADYDATAELVTFLLSHPRP
jgi:polyhydroxybutyrate depolymerase